MSIEDKYSRLAYQFSERSYADVYEFMRHRAELILKWGPVLEPGDRVLELACGDGYLGCLLVRHGLRYTGTDVAPGMIDVARRRAQAEGLQTTFLVMDMNHPDIQGEFEVIFSFARSFFTYAGDPLKVLRWMRAHARKKVLVDWDHFSPIPLRKAVRIVQEAGFTNVEFRPFLVPMTRKIPGLIQHLLYVLERFPRLSLPLTNKKFFVIIKGEIA